MKRSAKLLIMLGVLAVLTIGALIQRQFFPAETDSDYSDDGASTVAYAANDIVADNVTEISYESAEASLSFVKSSDVWVLKEERAPQIDSELVTSMVTAISGLSGSNKMENVAADKLVNYGLDEPSLRVRVTVGDKESSFIFGDYNKTAKEYYFCDEASLNTVYTVVSSSYEAFAYTLEDLLVFETLTEIAADSITSISLSDSENEVTVTSVKTPTNENEEGYTYSATRTENGESSDYSYADFYSLAEAIGEWNIDEFVTCDIDADAEYGFDTPKTLTVNYIEHKELEAEGASGGYIDTEKSYTLILGSADENGIYYCKTSEDSRMIYKLSSALFSTVLY